MFSQNFMKRNSTKNLLKAMGCILDDPGMAKFEWCWMSNPISFRISSDPPCPLVSGWLP